MKKLILIAAVLLVSAPSFAGLTREGDYKVDLAHTNVGFDVAHMGISLVVGRFNTFDGNVKFVPDGESVVNFEIDVASVDTNNKKRDRHLRSGDFFNSTVHPKITFTSTSVEYGAEGDPAVINGQLTLHGVTKAISFQVETHGADKGPRGKYRVGYEATATIKRTDFGMDKLLMAAGDEVTIRVNIEIIEKK